MVKRRRWVRTEAGEQTKLLLACSERRAISRKAQTRSAGSWLAMAAFQALSERDCTSCRSTERSQGPWQGKGEPRHTARAEQREGGVKQCLPPLHPTCQAFKPLPCTHPSLIPLLNPSPSLLVSPLPYPALASLCGAHAPEDEQRRVRPPLWGAAHGRR